MATLEDASSSDYALLMNRFKLLNLVQRVAHRDVMTLIESIGLDALSYKGARPYAAAATDGTTAMQDMADFAAQKDFRRRARRTRQFDDHTDTSLTTSITTQRVPATAASSLSPASLGRARSELKAATAAEPPKRRVRRVYHTAAQDAFFARLAKPRQYYKEPEIDEVHIYEEPPLPPPPHMYSVDEETSTGYDAPQPARMPVMHPLEQEYVLFAEGEEEQQQGHLYAHGGLQRQRHPAQPHQRGAPQSRAIAHERRGSGPRPESQEVFRYRRRPDDKAGSEMARHDQDRSPDKIESTNILQPSSGDSHDGTPGTANSHETALPPTAQQPEASSRQAPLPVAGTSILQSGSPVSRTTTPNPQSAFSTIKSASSMPMSGSPSTPSAAQHAGPSMPELRLNDMSPTLPDRAPHSSRVGRSGFGPKAKPKIASMGTNAPMDAIQHAAQLISRRREVQTPGGLRHSAEIPPNEFPLPPAADTYTGHERLQRASVNVLHSAGNSNYFTQASTSPVTGPISPVARPPGLPPKTLQELNDAVNHMLRDHRRLLQEVAKGSGSDGDFEKSSGTEEGSGAAAELKPPARGSVFDDPHVRAFLSAEEDADELYLYTDLESRLARMDKELRAMQAHNAGEGGEEEERVVDMSAVDDETAASRRTTLDALGTQPHVVAANASRRPRGTLPLPIAQRLLTFRKENMEYIAYNERVWNSSPVSQYTFAHRLTDALLNDCWAEVMDEVGAIMDEYVDGLAEHELQ